MAPSTDEFLHYIYVNSAGSLLLILVNMGFLSAVVLLYCSFFTRRVRKNEIDLTEKTEKRPASKLIKVTMHKDGGTLDSNGTKHNAIPTDGETTEEKNRPGTPPLMNGTAHGSLKTGSAASSSSMKNRVLPLIPQDLPPPEGYDHLYDSVNEIKERIAQQAAIPDHSQMDTATNKKSMDNTSKTLSKSERENENELETLHRINPLYDSVDDLKDQLSQQGLLSVLISPETSEKDAESKSEEPQSARKIDKESLYSVVQKNKPSVKKSPVHNTATQGNFTGDSAVEEAVLQDEANRGTDDDQTGHKIAIPGQKPPVRSTSSVKLESVLDRSKKRSIKHNPMPNTVISVSVQVDQDQPPPVPIKCFDIESEIQPHANEEETGTANEMTA